MKMASSVAGIFAVLLLVSSSGGLAQGTPAPSAAAPAKAGPANRIEQRIKSLHDQLKVTAAEEPQWAAVAQVMRDNAQAIVALIAERREKAATMTAVDDLRSYQEVAEAHASGVAKLASAFQALYAVMPPEQQKNADAVFAKTKRRPPAKNKAN